MFGIIRNVKSKGVAARKVLQRMMHKRFEEDELNDKDHSAGHDHIKNEIDTMIM
jgi:hypothetical protein